MVETLKPKPILGQGTQPLGDLKRGLGAWGDRGELRLMAGLTLVLFVIW